MTQLVKLSKQLVHEMYYVLALFFYDGIEVADVAE